MAPLIIDSMTFIHDVHIVTSLNKDNTIQEAEVSFKVIVDWFKI